MEIRIRKSGAVMYESEFRAMFPNTGFPIQLTEQIINDFDGDVVFEGPQTQPTRYQIAFRDGVEKIEGKWYTKHSVLDMDAESIAAKDTQQANSVREQRNKELASCDWTQVNDAPVDKTAWASYRQALRDISAQDGFPWIINWPTKPE